MQDSILLTFGILQTLSPQKENNFQNFQCKMAPKAPKKSAANGPATRSTKAPAVQPGSTTPAKTRSKSKAAAAKQKTTGVKKTPPKKKPAAPKRKASPKPKSKGKGKGKGKAIAPTDNQDGNAGTAAVVVHSLEDWMKKVKATLVTECTNRQEPIEGYKKDLAQRIESYDRLKKNCQDAGVRNLTGTRGELDLRLTARNKKLAKDAAAAAAAAAAGAAGSSTAGPSNTNNQTTIPKLKVPKRPSLIASIDRSREWLQTVQTQSLLDYATAVANEAAGNASGAQSVPNHKQVTVLHQTMVSHLGNLPTAIYNVTVLNTTGGVGDHIKALAARHQLVTRNGLMKSDRTVSLHHAELSTQEYQQREADIADASNPRTRIYD